MKTLYLDIDGVLLGRNTDGRATLAKGAEEFIDYAITHYDCYWLTTHCKGDVQTVLDYLNPYCSSRLLEKLRMIKPTNFDTWKTEGIDFSREFIWVDDYLFNAEIEVLDKNGRIDSWIQINTNQDEDALVNLPRRLLVDNK